jgi:hypothetical protein
MGLFAHIVTYQVGKRRGRRSVQRQRYDEPHEGDPQCLKYASFCKNYGSCDGMECEYE